MKHSKISLRRRHLMIAGLAGVAAPATLYAAGTSQPLTGGLSASTAAEDMVVSGRILGADSKPLFNATVELWQAGAPIRASATTDGDGRFFTPLAGAGGRRGQIHYRVRHDGHTTRTKRLDIARDAGAHLQRDDAGVWRTTFGATLA